MNQVKGNGASSTLFQHDRPNNPNVSKFDYSRKINFSIDTGMIVPIDVVECYPGDKHSLSIKMALDTLPLVAPSLTNYKIITHWYFQKKRDLWKGWKTFSTKGRSGNVNLTVPCVDLSRPIVQNQKYTIETKSGKYSVYGKYFAISNHSLSAFIGVPPSMNGLYSSPNPTATTDIVCNIEKNYLPYTFRPDSQGQWSAQFFNEYTEAIKTGFNQYSKVSALPFVMYQSIVKHNYVNQNLLQDNLALFPVEGDDDWLLPYTIQNGVANYISGASDLPSGGKVNYDGVFSSDETEVDLRLLRYAMFDDDYFTTGLPWLQRGDETSLSYDIDVSGITATSSVENFNKDDVELIQITNNGSDYFNDNPYLVGTQVYDSGSGSYDLNVDVQPSPVSQMVPNPGHSSNFFTLALDKSGLAKTLNKIQIKTALSGAGVQKIELNANQLRSLIAMSVWQERNARVDGSYNRMIYQHWLSNPNSEEHKPVYIGGTVDYLNFSTVIQNSQSTNNSPLGSTAGFGSAGGNGSVTGGFVCVDHGYIMGVMIIKPETVYQQGVERFLTSITFDDFAQPEFQGLSPEAILNKELYVSDKDSDNDDMFCYQERYTYLKVRQNVNRGLMQCKPDKDILFSAYTQARWFNSVPKFSYQFLCMSPDNIRRDWLAFPSYPAFRCQLLVEDYIVRKLAYTSQPETFGF